MSGAKMRGFAQTYAVTRSTVRDEFRLPNNPQITNDVMYHCGYAAGENGMEIHLVVILDFQTLVICSAIPEVEDVSGFARDYHAQVARNMNSADTSSGQFWRGGGQGEKELFNIDDLLEVVANALSQPVRLGLVEDLGSWEERMFVQRDQNEVELEFSRPDYCGPRSVKPEEVVMRLSMCPLVEQAGWTPEQFIDRLYERVELKSREARQERQDRGLESVESRTNSVQQSGRLPVEPKVVTESDQAYTRRRLDDRAFRAFRRLYRAFLRAYREAFEIWRHAETRDSAVFPPGTLKVHQVHDAPIGIAETAAAQLRLTIETQEREVLAGLVVD